VKRRRPRQHYRSIKTKKGRKKILINKGIKRKRKNYGGLPRGWNPKSGRKPSFKEGLELSKFESYGVRGHEVPVKKALSKAALVASIHPDVSPIVTHSIDVIGANLPDKVTIPTGPKHSRKGINRALERDLKKRRNFSMGLIMPVGISGSGKSTKMKKIKGTIVSPDNIRLELTDKMGDQSRNKEVFELAHKRADKLLSKGKDVIFDATNVHPLSRKELYELAKKNKTTTDVYLFKTPVPLAASRIKKRAEAGGLDVPISVLKRQKRILGSQNIKEEPHNKIEIIDARKQ